MWIDLDDEISKPMIHNIEDKEGNPTGQQRIVIPGFDFYSKEVGTGSGQNRITTFAYEIRTSPKNSTMLKHLLCKLSEENINDIKFIPYGLDNMTQNNTMRKSSYNKIHLSHGKDCSCIWNNGKRQDTGRRHLETIPIFHRY